MDWRTDPHFGHYRRARANGNRSLSGTDRSMTLAGSDQEHLETIIFDRPSTPDRTAYILDHSSPFSAAPSFCNRRANWRP